MARFFNLHQTTGLLQVHVAEQRATNRPIFNKRKFRVRHDACFCLGPFANEYTEIYQEHIRKPLSKCGIEVKRADEVYNVRPVRDSFWESMNQSAIIIVELSGRNLNVLYEIGMAHVVGKKVIIIARSVEDVPFDLRSQRVLLYAKTGEGLKRLEHRIVSTVQSERGLARERGRKAGKKDGQHKLERDRQEGDAGTHVLRDNYASEYNQLVQRAFYLGDPYQVIRETLAKVAEGAVPLGRHSIYLRFLTDHPGVRLSEQLRQRYPAEMTVVLQHEFWDLEAGDEGFAVMLSFSGVRERLLVPYRAVTQFGDPQANFGLDFKNVREEQVRGQTPG